MSENEFKQLKSVLRIVWIALGTNIVVILGAVWFISAMHENVKANARAIERIQTECVEEAVKRSDMDWRYNDYFTRYLWAERWNQALPDPPYNMRGVAPNL